MKQSVIRKFDTKSSMGQRMGKRMGRIKYRMEQIKSFESFKTKNETKNET